MCSITILKQFKDQRLIRFIASLTIFVGLLELLMLPAARKEDIFQLPYKCLYQNCLITPCGISKAAKFHYETHIYQ